MEMLMNALRVLVNNPFKKVYMRKKKKLMIAFFISHKSDVKIFLK